VIAVVGESVIDRTDWPDGRTEDRLGGAPVYAARALRDVLPAAFLTRGIDELSMYGPLRSCAANLVIGPPTKSTVFAVSLHGDGTWSESLVTVGEPFRATDVEGWMAPSLRPCPIVVCGTQWRGDFTAETVASLAAGGRRVYLDGQGMARAARPGPLRLHGPIDRKLIRQVDVLKLSEEETVALLGGVDRAAAERAGVPVLVVTLAERGALVFAGGEAVRVAPHLRVDLTDTVGAGDGFLALMAAADATGAAPVDAAKRACDGVADLLLLRQLQERRRSPHASLAIRR
jgi:pfkB family carbohydrate kinase